MQEMYNSHPQEFEPVASHLIQVLENWTTRQQDTIHDVRAVTALNTHRSGSDFIFFRLLL